jgi:hypothetical protein
MGIQKPTLDQHFERKKNIYITNFLQKAAFSQ